MNELTKQIPQLVDLSKFKTKLLKPEQVFSKTKWNINKILLVGFIVFSVFFLYNCRYGIFRSKENTLYNS